LVSKETTQWHMRFDEVVTFAFSLEDVIEVGMTKWAGPDGPAR